MLSFSLSAALLFVLNAAYIDFCYFFSTIDPFLVYFLSLPISILDEQCRYSLSSCYVNHKLRVAFSSRRPVSPDRATSCLWPQSMLDLHRCSYPFPLFSFTLLLFISLNAQFCGKPTSYCCSCLHHTSQIHNIYFVNTSEISQFIAHSKTF